MAAEFGEREVFLGYDAKDQYLCMGNFYGPGTVTVPNNVADHLEAAVRRVQLSRPEEDRINPGVVQPAPVMTSKATKEQLLAALAALETDGEPEQAEGQPQTPVEPNGEPPTPPNGEPPAGGQAGGPPPL